MSASSSSSRKHDFLPSREADLLDWSCNFNHRINQAPAAYGLTAAQATAYAQLHDAFAAAYALAVDPCTNSKANVVAKNNAKAALKANARMLARLINATPGVTDDQRGRVGLTIPDKHLTPARVPTEAPRVSVRETLGRTVRLRLYDRSSSTRRGKPPGVAGAVVLYYIAAEQCSKTDPPASLSQWSYCGLAMRPTFTVTLPPGAPEGSRVWFTACGFNRRGKTGPASFPVFTCISPGASNLPTSPRLAA